MVERNQIADLKRVLATIRLQIQVLEASVLGGITDKLAHLSSARTTHHKGTKAR